MRIRQGTDSDAGEVVSIFNHYVVHGFAAYPETPVPGQFFDVLREGVHSLSVIDSPEGVIGFGLTRPFLPFPAFRQTGMLAYFILPGYLNRGLGSRLLDVLIREGKEQGIAVMLANMSSGNEASIRFHQEHGFVETGRLRNVGIKFGEPFDSIWMQKEI